ncbi:hypothetical protein RND71_011210 [Anisodus tanguticus]|uniref:Uncharacterized protein n=1 Tax=Anisodus tanguticus TaxID=243964 RepID=A0AAE1VEW1_9SOLA|nr:hypothetical protein RND71_011210 [Anisodus tanguticus]
MLFHYDGRTSEWDDLEWSARAIHVSIPKQTKWYASREFFLSSILQHILMDLFIKLVRKHGLDISQPGLAPNSGLTWQMTKGEMILKETEGKPGYCADPHLPPCATFVEIMAPTQLEYYGIRMKVGYNDYLLFLFQQGKSENGKAPWEVY